MRCLLEELHFLRGISKNLDRLFVSLDRFSPVIVEKLLVCLCLDLRNLRLDLKVASDSMMAYMSLAADSAKISPTSGVKDPSEAFFFPAIDFYISRRILQYRPEGFPI